jgi:hypothetical protein
LQNLFVFLIGSLCPICVTNINPLAAGPAQGKHKRRKCIPYPRLHLILNPQHCKQLAGTRIALDRVSLIASILADFIPSYTTNISFWEEQCR